MHYPLLEPLLLHYVFPKFVFRYYVFEYNWLISVKFEVQVKLVCPDEMIAQLLR